MYTADFSCLFSFPEPRKLRRRVYPLFLPFSGCGERCLFCAQEIQTGVRSGPVEDRLKSAARDLSAGRDCASGPPELAFFGGTFTALPEKEFSACLRFAERVRKEGFAAATRCSTRPDALSPSRLTALKNAGFSLVELGVQSFSDCALARSRRGYSGQTAQEACEAVSAAGLDLGIQLLPGMPGLDPVLAFADVERATSLGPVCVRLYPCLVLAGTPLADIWRGGEYVPWELDLTTDFLARACLTFWQKGIAVIRLGLAEEPGFAALALAGPRHPSFGSMVKGLALHYYLRDKILAAVPPPRGNAEGSPAKFALFAPRFCQGEFWGWKGSLIPLYAGIGLHKGNVFWWEKEDFFLCPGLSASTPTQP
jgi:histone acetyltransferase (RNA polymerase elongator complex component)